MYLIDIVRILNGGGYVIDEREPAAGYSLSGAVPAVQKEDR
jgi:hypothetical protein